jgi:membrane protease YdiL (CAAX protease family)
MMKHPGGLLAVLLIVMVTVIAPVSEELIFRGILQSLVGAYTERPWLAIGTTALVFAMVHGNPTHWPALFVLSLGLGYSYEKSNSLWRPIFMHALFNGVTVGSNLIG